MSEETTRRTADHAPAAKWIVVGGSGFIGSEIVDAARREGADAMAVSAPRLRYSGPRDRELLTQELKSQSETIQTLASTIAGASVVVNAAGLAEPDSADTDDLYGANALLPLVIAAAVRASGKATFIHLSSAAVQGGAAELNDRPEWSPFSPYSRSKTLAEQVLIGALETQPDVIVVRATSVQGRDRRTTRSLQRLAQSRLSSVAHPGTQPSPVSSVKGLAEFVVAVGTGAETARPLLLQPWEGGTVASVLGAAGGGRRPLKLPRLLCRTALGAGWVISAVLGGRFNGHVRRVELAWFGQPQSHSVPSIRPTNFEALSQALTPMAPRSARGAHLGILSQWFDPETGPAALPGVFAREMIDQGHPVSVLTGFPNYPGGQIYPGFQQALRQRNIANGMTITRVPLKPSHDSSTLGRMANYLSFSLSATFLGARALNRAEAVWVYNSPATVSLPLLIHTRFGRKPYFLHVQDLWPESLINSGMFPGGTIGRVAARSIRIIVGITERRATAIGVISPSVRQMIIDRNPNLDASKIHYVPNPTDESIFVDVAAIDESRAPNVPWSNQLTFMYVGAVGELQGLDTVLDAAKLVQGAEIVIVGDGVARERLAQRAADESIANVTFYGRIGKEAVPGFMATSDVQIVSLSDDEFLRYTTPSKISSIMATSLPILGQISGDGADLISKAGCGVAVEPGDAEALASAIRRFAAMDPTQRRAMGVLGHEYYHRHMSTRATTAKILGTLGYADARSAKL